MSHSPRPPRLVRCSGFFGLAGLTLTLALSACASAPPPAPVIVDAAPVPEKVDTGPTAMESEIGGLNEDAMDAAFNSLDVTRCVEQHSVSLDQLGGELKLKLRIDKKGSARWAYLSRSTLGDRDAEKCVLDLVKAKSWPRPLGGEGLAEKEFTIDPRAEPVSLDERRTMPQVAQARAEAGKCRRGVPGSFFATVYLQPDGKVLAAGVSVPSEKGEDVADCVVEAVRKVRFRGTPKPAKLSFEIR
jgi:hypothetical protein